MQKFADFLAQKIDGTVAILNGVIGDTLEKRKSGFATQMALYRPDHSLFATGSRLKKSVASDASPLKISILAHGSCGDEKGWRFKRKSAVHYGSLLEKEFGFIPLFLRYNSGLHISTNGRRLSNLLEKLVLSSPQKIGEILLIGHSMGGLVFRSACYYGEKEKKKWVKRVKKIFYLGSPHLGTHLEKIGKLTTAILQQIPNPITKMIVFLGDLRSAGVKDLRHGYLADEEWKKKNADHLFYWHENKIPLLKNADHYLICGTLSRVAGSRWGRLFGDGLVHPASGTGQGLFSSSATGFSKKNCRVLLGISHAELKRSRRVYQQIQRWCKD